MSGWAVALTVGLLAAILSVLLTISKQIEQLIRVMIHQRQQLEQAVSHPRDDQIRFELEVFLKEANKDAHAETRRRVDEFLNRGSEADKT